MNRKQEAIEEMEDALNTAFGMGKQNEDRMFAQSKLSESLYDLTAPLMRGEFPEEKFKNIIWNAHLRGQCWTTYGHGNLNLRIDDLLEEAKCLWEGDHIVEVNKKVCDNIPEQQSKGRLVVASTLRPCQTCGGNGYSILPRLGDEPCPDCDGTGECQHRNRFHNRISRYNIKWYWCEDCKQAIYTERSGKERRNKAMWGIKVILDRRLKDRRR